MVKSGAKSASHVQAGTFGELDSPDHDLPQQRYDRPGLVPGKRDCLRKPITIGSEGCFRHCRNSKCHTKQPLPSAADSEIMLSDFTGADKFVRQPLFL